MKKNYLLMAAAAMLLASCSSESDAPKNEGENNNEDVIALSTLSSASQAGRITNVNGTRADKKNERIQLQYKIAPVNDAQSFGWSATGLAIDNGNVYVTWHSDFQASKPASKWGGALDVIAFGDGTAPSFTNTYVSYDAKFNNVVVGNSAFYLALTDKKKGAAVARVAAGATEGLVRQLAGSSANALSIANGRVYAATGFKNGGIYSLAADFAEPGNKSYVDTIAKMTGCKFIDGDLVLGTTNENAYIASLDGTQTWNIGAPLASELKANLEYDKDTDTWVEISGSSSTYYGKHTMAVDGNYIYVAGGQAASGTKNGLRVIDKATMQQVWGNATNTTAVCVKGDYVYAATGAGLRVYKKFDGTNLELFAFETITGTDDKPVAGTDAHSCNFVAVDDNYIYMANGQSGVYVFTLDTTAPAPETPAE